jgi:CubicO group peptidase (beta-lactamase class C family)
VAAGDPHGRQRITRSALHEPLENPPGHAACYSDVGFIILGALLEQVTGIGLERLFAEQVAAPLGLADTGFNPGNRHDAFPPERLAATTPPPEGGPPRLGRVHDDNALRMDGVAGHAGLFGTAADVGRWARALLNGWHGRGDFLPQAVARRYLSRDGRAPGSSWTLGFDTPSPPSSAGTQFGPDAVGHLGYTGTSVWIDLTREWVAVLLTNRVHPDGGDDRIRSFRPQFHEAAAAAWLRDGPAPTPGG